MSSVLRTALSQVCPDGWIVGGAVRDRLLGRPVLDIDVIAREDPAQVARAVARGLGAHGFMLSGEWGAWRVVSRRDGWQLDVMGLDGTLEQDLRARDLTVNAIAETIAEGELVDPLGGVADLDRGLLRAVSDHSFVSDPLRTLRLVRFAAELGFDIEPSTAASAARSSVAIGSAAAERIWAELRRVVCSERPLAGLAQLESLGLTAIVLPELLELHDVAQNRYHHRDVHGHTLEVLERTIELTEDPAGLWPESHDAVAAVLAEPLADELSRAQALRFGALFHDIAKPRTRGELADGRVTFFGHDELGAEMSQRILRRWRASERLVAHVAALTRDHLRLGFLVHAEPLSPRDMHAYLTATGPVGVDVTVLSCADRLATRGDGHAQAIERHLRLARRVMPAALAWRADPPRPPVRGDELAAAAGVAPGPALGPVLAELEAAAYAGELRGRGEALERGVELLRATPPR